MDERLNLWFKSSNKTSSTKASFIAFGEVYLTSAGVSSVPPPLPHHPSGSVHFYQVWNEVFTDFSFKTCAIHFSIVNAPWKWPCHQRATQSASCTRFPPLHTPCSSPPQQEDGDSEVIGMGGREGETVRIETTATSRTQRASCLGFMRRKRQCKQQARRHLKPSSQTLNMERNITRSPQ